MSLLREIQEKARQSLAELWPEKEQTMGYKIHRKYQDAYVDNQILDVADLELATSAVSAAVTQGPRLEWFDRIQRQWDAGHDIACVDLRPPSQVVNIPLMLTVEQAQALWKFEINHSKGRDACPPGHFYWRLGAIYFRTGPAQSIHKVLTKTGYALEGILGYATS